MKALPITKQRKLDKIIKDCNKEFKEMSKPDLHQKAGRYFDIVEVEDVIRVIKECVTKVL